MKPDSHRSWTNLPSQKRQYRNLRVDNSAFQTEGQRFGDVCGTDLELVAHVESRLSAPTGSAPPTVSTNLIALTAPFVPAGAEQVYVLW